MHNANGRSQGTHARYGIKKTKKLSTIVVIIRYATNYYNYQDTIYRKNIINDYLKRLFKRKYLNKTDGSHKHTEFKYTN